MHQAHGLGLSSKLYPSNLQYMLNKDLTRFISAEYFSSGANSNKRKKGSASRVAEQVKLPKLAEHFVIFCGQSKEFCLTLAEAIFHALSLLSLQRVR